MKKKKLLVLLLTASMLFGSVPCDAFAADLSSSNLVDIMDIVEDDKDVYSVIEIMQDGSCFADGKEMSLYEALGISEEECSEILEEGVVSDYLYDLGYDCSYDNDCLVATAIYNAKRLYVGGVNLVNTHDAVAVVESGGISLLEYKTVDATRNAQEMFEEEGYFVTPDMIISGEDATSYTYSADTLGQYGQTVYDSTHTGSVTTAPEIMGLSTSGASIVSAQSTTPINEVSVGVLDSGIDTTNSIFSGRVKSGYNVVSSNTNVLDDYGHGTFISSIIVNNTPSNVKIVPVKLADSTGSFTASRLASALQYINDNSDNFDVLNLSLSICTLNSAQMDQVASFINPFIDSLYEKGIVIITSAGNKNSSYPTMTADDSYPANYDKTLAVGALTYNGSSWSAYSKSLTGNCVDFTAPGHNIRGVQATTMNMTKASASNSWTAEYMEIGDGTCLMSGTSQATAFVTAAAADILSYNSYMKSSELENLMKSNSTKSVVSGTDGSADSVFGYGYPELSGYVYATGVYQSSTGGYSGLVNGYDVVVDNASHTVKLVKYKGSSQDVTVADSYTINGVTYDTVIGKSTATTGPFQNNTDIHTVTFGSNVKCEDNDGSYMFYGCSSLSSINRIPDGIVDASYMFYGCRSLLAYPTVPLTVKKMDHMFDGCTSATGTCKIESGIVDSATDAFKGDTATVSVPAGSTTEDTLKALVSSWPNVTIVYNSGTSSGASGGGASGGGASGGGASGGASGGGASGGGASGGASGGGASGGASTTAAKTTTSTNNSTTTSTANNSSSTNTTNTSTSTNTTSTTASKGGTVKVTFKYRNVKANKNGDVVVRNVTKGKTVKKPENPKVKGYYFAGWYTLSGKKFNFKSAIKEDTMLVAKYISKKVPTESIKSVKKVSNKKFKISYKKIDYTKNYQIMYGKSKNLKTSNKEGTVISKKTTKTIKTKEKGTYYVKVRSVRKLGNKTYYGKWSKIKKVKV